MENIAPGMERTVNAGDTLVIQDSEGQQFAVSGREAPQTMEFLIAFDEWFELNRLVSEETSSPMLDAAWLKVKEAYSNLPSWITRDFPSMKQAVLLKRT